MLLGLINDDDKINDDENVNVNLPSGRHEGDVVALLSEAKASVVATDAPSASASSLTSTLKTKFL